MTQYRSLASRSQEMAATLLRGHDEAGLDLGDEGLIDDWLHAAMYTDGQICLHRREALDHARASLKARAPAATNADLVQCHTAANERAEN